ncbi:3-hydroxyisobutyrate dehydrogenase [Candidatus Phycosocius spiralis]|uniref:3-hydroxyisobutyrate dehydrogenase n=1 Tax=Candidatus Phycosocius spiralis TaxID=2815099 RepID=A0ABQ4PS98_9PROT|nr:3-hydroxyisobutyrate dehydrogenase [Candidatus Phycosocius spiralis]GIU65887.1 3-hydroxyisobutyrate dehydrogenase [Candidatus Phycosocius spiralis]
MVDIAFIGLGAMGGGMAANLAKAGHRVIAFDLSEPAVTRATQAGCQRARSIAEAVCQARVIVTMLPSGAHVLDVYRSSDGVMAHAPSGALFLDCSTISVQDARTLAHEATKAGFRVCDAPVSGGVGAAQAGTLTFMVGGTDAEYKAAKPILAAMGKAIIHAGAHGAGQSAKICNNMLLAVTMIGTCEAFVLAERLGLDPKAFFEIASQSSGQSWSMTSYAPVPGLVENAPSNRNFTNGFAITLMLKDLRLALAANSECGLKATLALKAEEIYSEYLVKFGPNRDFSGVIDLMKEE